MLIRKSAAAIERTIAEREIAAAAVADEVQANRATLSDAMDDGARYDRAFASIAAKESRLAAIRASLDPLRAELQTARQREGADDLLKRAAALRRQVAAEMKEYSTKIEPHLAAVADFAERYQRTRRDVECLNEELREAGRKRTIVGGATHVDRKSGYEDVQVAVPEGMAHPTGFFRELHIPASRAGKLAIWRGVKS